MTPQSPKSPTPGKNAKHRRNYFSRMLLGAGACTLVCVLLVFALFLRNSQEPQVTEPDFRGENALDSEELAATKRASRDEEDRSNTASTPIAVPNNTESTEEADEHAQAHPTAPKEHLDQDLGAHIRANPPLNELFDEMEVLEERIETPDEHVSDQDAIRERLIRTKGKYPLIASREFVDYDPTRDKPLGRVNRREVMVADHIVVSLDNPDDKDRLEQVAAANGGRIRRQVRGPAATFLVQIPEPGIRQVNEAVTQFSARKQFVKRAEPDYIAHVFAEPDDDMFGHLWGMHNVGQQTVDYNEGGMADADIDAVEAWDIATGSHDVLVAVIDTGIEYDHPDLQANMWNNPGEVGVDGEGNDKRTNGIDDDGNGYVDDWRGWNFVDDTNDPMDDHYHGTHCAGTIAGVGNNSIGVAGVNWQSSLVGLKCLNSGGAGSSSDLTEAIWYATSLGVDLTSNSWGGGGFSQAMSDAIEDADQNGVLFVAAAGNSSGNNDNVPFYPASYDIDNVIAVAATDHNDQLASFSCYGAASVDVGAPGVNILSTLLQSKADELGEPDTPYGSISGTSMACPHVAGAAALLKSWVPSMTHREIRDRLLAKVDPISGLDGKVASGGRLNVFNVLDGVSEEPTLEIEQFSFDDSTGGNGDGIMNPGETVVINIDIRNLGWQDASGVTATLSTAAAGISVTDPNAAYGTVASRTISTPSESFAVHTDSEVTPPLEASFDVTFTDDQARTWEHTVTIGVYNSYTVSGLAQLDGAPCPDVRITAAGPVARTTTTGADGMYELVLGDGEYQLTASFGDSPTAVSESVTTTLPGGTDDIPFDFTTATIAGTVSRDDSTPVAGATVNYNGPETGTLTTNAEGEYNLTRIYGRSNINWTLDAAKPNEFPYHGNPRQVTVPPDALDVDFTLAPPELEFAPDSMLVNAVLGENPIREATVQNNGPTRLDWNADTVVEINSAPGQILKSVPSAPLYSEYISYPSGTACDGTHLYTHTGGLLHKQSLDTGDVVETIDLAQLLIGYDNFWRLLCWDGQRFWFLEQVKAPDDHQRGTHRLHAVDIENAVLLRSVDVDSRVYWNMNHSTALPFARIASQGAFGENAIWFVWMQKIVENGDNNQYFFVKIDPDTGERLALLPFPDIDYPYYLSAAAPAYAGGALWAAEDQYNVKYFDPGRGARMYKFDPTTGDIIQYVSMTKKQISTLVSDGQGRLWGRSNAKNDNKTYAFSTDRMPWVTASPKLGNLYDAETDGSTSVDLTFDSTLAGPGIHSAVLRFDSNDPQRPTASMPILFNVTESDNTENNAPVITESAPGSPVTMSETESCTFSVTATDPDGDPLSYQWYLDEKSVTHTTGAEWSYITDYDSAGGHAVSVVVDDGNGGVAHSTWQITVTNVNRPPTADTQSLAIANTESLDITLTGSDPDGQPLLFSIVESPAHGVLSGQAPNLQYTPNTDYTGSDSFSFRVSDGEDESPPATVDIQIGQREITAGLGSITVTAPLGSVVSRNLPIANLGDFRLQWASPMQAVSPVPRAGKTRTLINGLAEARDTSEAYRSTGICFDGSHIFTASHDYDLQVSVLSKVNPNSNNLADTLAPAAMGTWAFAMQMTPEGDIWALNHDMSWGADRLILRCLSVSDSVLIEEQKLSLWAPDMEQDLLAAKGVSFGMDKVWISGYDMYLNGALQEGFMYRFDAETGNYEGKWDYPNDRPGGMSAMWNGALWVSHDNQETMNKHNPFTGEELGTFELHGGASDVLLSTKDIAPDREGGFYCFIHRSQAANDLDHFDSGDFMIMSPADGALDGGASQDIEIEFDTNVVGVGTHEAVLHVLSNDSSNPDIEIPVTFIVTEEGSNNPPVIDALSADPAEIMLPADTVTLTAVASDPDGDQVTYAWSKGDGPGPVSFSTPGASTTDAAFETPGTYFLQIEVSEGELSTVGTVQVDVAEYTNTGPVAEDQQLETTEDTAIEITLTATDAENDPLSYTVLEPPAHGTLSGTAPNLSYSPDSGYYGTDSFAFKANDGQEDSNTATVSITINFIDSDGNNLPDSWEQQIIDADPEDGFNSVADVLPEGDFDSDGRSNFLEYAFCLDPTSATEPNRQTVEASENGEAPPYIEVTLHVRSNDPNLSYTVETCPDLAQETWTGEALTHENGTWSTAHAQVSVVAQTEESPGVWTITLRFAPGSNRGFIRMGVE